MTPFRKALFIATAGSLFWAASNIAQAGNIVKWVDSQGVTHYGEKAPEGVKAAPVKIVDTTSSDADAEIDRLNKTRESARESAANAAGTDAAEGKPPVKKPGKDAKDDTADANKKNCAQHRKNLEALKSGRLPRIIENGKPRVMTEAERKAQQELTESEIRRCEQIEKLESARQSATGGK